MKPIKITTNKIPNETEQQYTAWLLYCEAGSLGKTIRSWEGIWHGSGSEVAVVFRERLGKPAGLRTISRWSKQYRWVERKDLKLTEDLKVLREKTKKIKREKLHKTAEAFEKIANKILKRLKEGEESTISEWKQVWEMFQVELGKPTSRTMLNEEQRPLTEEEKKEKKKLDAALKKYIDSDDYRKGKNS
jgi:hypothetical protein